VLETEDEPLMRKPSAKKDVPVDGGVAGLEGEERATVVKRMFLLPSLQTLEYIVLTTSQ
jgi:serine/threonine-protein kinase ULK/ATG1